LVSALRLRAATGFDAEEARDLTQAYFARLLEKGYLDDYDPDRGRFRVFLKASVKHFLSKERDKERSWKRGGRAGIISLDDEQIEGRYRFEPVDRLTPEQLYERRWALTVLEQARTRLREERVAAGRELEYLKVEGFLTGQGPQDRYKDIAAELGTTEDAVKRPARSSPPAASTGSCGSAGSRASTATWQPRRPARRPTSAWITRAPSAWGWLPTRRCSSLPWGSIN
jgi:hypothetical protein